MKIKSGVRLENLRPVIVLALAIADDVFKSMTNESLVITSVSEGIHKKDSLHYRGLAVDIRKPRNYMFGNDIDSLSTKLASHLGDNFDVVVEDTHIHIEYDPAIQNVADIQKAALPPT